MPLDYEMDDMKHHEDLVPPDERRHRRLLDSRVQADGELSDSDDEGEGERRDRSDFKERDSDSRSHSSDTEVVGGMRKFGIGVGILNSGPAGSTHGAGPSGHTILVPQTVIPPAPMDVDDIPPVEEMETMSGEATQTVTPVSSEVDKEKGGDHKPSVDAEVHEGKTYD